MIKPGPSRLRMLVHVVVLDLREIPVVGVYDPAELLAVAVIGEPDVPDLPAFFLRGDPLPDPQRLQFRPLRGVGHHVHEVIVDVIRLKARKFLVEIPVDRAAALHEVLRELCGDTDPVPHIVAAQDLAERRFASGIDVGGVEIVDAGFDGRHDLLFRLIDIDAPCLRRKAHAPVAERREFLSVFVFPVLHFETFIFL